MTYQTQIGTAPDGSLNPAGWLKVSASTMQDAAIAALQHAGVKRVFMALYGVRWRSEDTTR